VLPGGLRDDGAVDSGRREAIAGGVLVGLTVLAALYFRWRPGPIFLDNWDALATGIVTALVSVPAVAGAATALVINGCTIVSNPTATNFTNCPGADLNHTWS
jgi:hypothetical protein